MIFGNDILARLHDLYARRYEPEGVRALADLYWRIVLLIAAVAVIASFAFGAWDLMSVFKELAVPTNTSLPPAPVLNSSQLRTVVQGFGERQAQYDSLQSNPPTVIPDPGM